MNDASSGCTTDGAGRMTPAGGEIEIVVNGEPRRIPACETLAQALAALGAPALGCAIEKNGRIIPRSTHGSEAIRDGDRLEIVTFVGGG